MIHLIIGSSGYPTRRRKGIFPPPLGMALALTLAGGAYFAVAAHAGQMGQSSQMGQQPVVSDRMGQRQPMAQNAEGEPPDPVFQERRMRALNTERQKEMVSDTDKLLKLTTELNAEIAHANSGELTPDEFHKLEKIEKLAKSVKEKMCNPVQTTLFENSFPAPGGPVGVP